MKKWLASEESKKITGVLLVLFLALIVQIIGFLEFNTKLYNLSLEHLTQQVEELSIYVEKTFELELERYIKILKVTELQLQKEDEMFSQEAINRLKKVQNISKLKMAGISDLDGKGVDSTGKAHNIYYEQMREHIENNEVYISNVLKDGMETLIFIAVPLKNKGEICGALWGKYELADLVENIKFSDDSYKYFQIVDDKGNYLLSSNSKFAFNKDLDEFSLWEELEAYQYTEGVSSEKIVEMIKNRESGNFYFESEGQGCYVEFRPLRINNWYLFSVQAEDGLRAYVDRTRRIAVHFFMMLAIGLLSIFSVTYNLTYTMYKKIADQHREIRAINTMFQATLEQTKNIPFTIDRKNKQVILYGYPTKNVTQYCSFMDMHPENMLKKGLINADSIEKYQQLYQNLILQGKACEPQILCAQMGKELGWIRISIISDDQNNTDQMIGVVEDYAEHKEKDLQIETHLDSIKKIEQKSQIDFLTKLYNRETFLEKIQIALKENIENQQIGAFLILDLDHFKEANDCLGHGIGDVVLQTTANTLCSFFRKEDIIGRLGGDEFVVFAKNIRDVQAFGQRIKELNGLLCKSYYKDGKGVQVSASIGIMLTDAAHTTFQTLYEKADQALYKVKQTSRNGYHIYSEKE